MFEFASGEFVPPERNFQAMLGNMDACMAGCLLHMGICAVVPGLHTVAAKAT